MYPICDSFTEAAMFVGAMMLRDVCMLYSECGYGCNDPRNSLESSWKLLLVIRCCIGSYFHHVSNCLLLSVSDHYII